MAKEKEANEKAMADMKEQMELEIKRIKQDRNDWKEKAGELKEEVSKMIADMKPFGEEEETKDGPK